MESMDPALLADMIFQWHETPLFFTLTENDLNPQQLDHSNSMDHNMVVDIDLPPSQWSTSDSTPPTDILHGAGAMSDSNVVKHFPLVQMQKLGATTIDGGLVKASSEVPTLSPPPVSEPVTPPAVKQTRRLSCKPGPKAKLVVATKRRGILVDDGAAQREHIIRERQRRDDMAAKYLVLESLLPPTPKREKAVVVEDATVLVRALQQKKSQLLKRRAHLQASTQLHCSARSTVKIHIPPISSNLPESLRAGTQHYSAVRSTGRKYNNSCKADISPLLSSSSEGAMEVVQHEDNLIFNTGRNSKSAVSTSTINVHTAGKDDMEVEMVWTGSLPPPHNFQSVLLQALENLGSEVIRCSLVRVAPGFTQCFITCSKPQVPLQFKRETKAAETLIMEALRNVVVQYS